MASATTLSRYLAKGALDDGKTDLAITKEFDATISILYGNTDGTFQQEVYVAVGSEPTSIAAGDFNGAVNSDLIAACVYSGAVTVLLNNGGGNTPAWRFSNSLVRPYTT
ncbi:MAG TPA: VCBS repeat-containing protein [Chloroflexota bacterium]